MNRLTEVETRSIIGGEITIAAVMAAMAAAIVAVVIYRLFMSDKGNVSLPGGFKFKFTT